MEKERFLDVYVFFQEDLNNGNGSRFQPNVIMQGHSPSDYVLNVVSNIHPNDLNVPFWYVFSPVMDSLTTVIVPLDYTVYF
jgi:hypothetical protein